MNEKLTPLAAEDNKSDSATNKLNIRFRFLGSVLVELVL